MSLSSAKRRFEFALEQCESAERKAFYEAMIELTAALNIRLTEIERELHALKNMSRGPT